VDESDVKGFDGAAWQGLSMPAGVPREIVNRVHADLIKPLRSPAIKEQIIGMGGMVSANTPAEFTAFIRTEIGKWATVAKAAKVTGD